MTNIDDLLAEVKVREIWLNGNHLDFDLNWRWVQAAEYPHCKSTAPSDVRFVDRESFDKVVAALVKCVEQRNNRINGLMEHELCVLKIEKLDAELEAILKGGG